MIWRRVVIPPSVQLQQMHEKGGEQNLVQQLLNTDLWKAPATRWAFRNRGYKSWQVSKAEKPEAGIQQSHQPRCRVITEIEIKVWCCTGKERLPFGAGPGTPRVTAVLSTETGGYVEGGGGTGTCVWLVLTAKRCPLFCTVTWLQCEQYTENCQWHLSARPSCCYRC